MSKREEGKWETTTKRVRIRWGTCRTCKSKIVHRDDHRRHDAVVGYDPGIEISDSPTQCDSCRKSRKRSCFMANLRKALVGACITGLEFNDRGILSDVYVDVPHSKAFGGKSGSCSLSASSIAVVPDCPQDSDDDESDSDDDA